MSLTLDVLERLIAFNTVSARSNLEIIAYIREFLESRGFRVTPIPGASEVKSGLYAEIGPTGNGILLSAHTDVVPVEGQEWTRDPFALSREGDRLFGRGTTDMKGFVACMLNAADKVSRMALKEPLKLALSYDEEIGCVGIREMAGQLAPLLGQPRLCIVGEPTQMQVAIGHKGKAAIRATCKGQDGHSALAPKFVNALHLAADFIIELRGIQQRLAESGARDDAFDIPYSTVHVGTLNGGLALNIVPEEAVLTFEYRHLAEDSSEKIFADIQAAASEVGKQYANIWDGTEIQLDRYNAYPGLSVREGDPIISLLQGFARTNSTIKVPYGTEAGVFADLGVPTLVCGPGSMEGQGHKPDEFIELGQLKACEDMLDRALADLS